MGTVYWKSYTAPACLPTEPNLVNLILGKDGWGSLKRYDSNFFA